MGQRSGHIHCMATDSTQTVIVRPDGKRVSLAGAPRDIYLAGWDAAGVSYLHGKEPIGHEQALLNPNYQLGYSRKTAQMRKA